MPRSDGKQPVRSFQSEDISGNEYEIRLGSEGDTQFSDIFAAQDLTISVAERSTSQLNTLNAGTVAITGPPGAVTATMTIFRNPDSPGQFKLKHAYDNDSDIVLRRTNHGSPVGLPSVVDGSHHVTVDADGKLYFTDDGLAVANDKGNLANPSFRDSIERGMVLAIETYGATYTNYAAAVAGAAADSTKLEKTELFFIERVHYDSSGISEIYVGSSTEDQKSDEDKFSFPFSGTKISRANVASKTIFARLIQSRKEVITYTGKVTAPPTPTDSSGDTGTGAERSTATVSFVFDDAGGSSFSTPEQAAA